MPSATRADLDARLRAAAAEAVFPPTPDLKDAVLCRIAELPGAAPGMGGLAPALPRVPLAGLRLGRALLAAVAILLLLAAIAGAAGLRLPGLDLVLGPVTPGPLASAGAGLELGEPLALADALALGRPAVRVPTEVRFARPDAVRALPTGAGTIVSLVYAAREDLPSIAGTDLALVIMAVPGSVDEGLLRKVLGPDSTLETVAIEGVRGWWISGAPHDLLILRDDGTAEYRRLGIAGDTLVFARDGTLYRLETALGRDRTLLVAASMR